MTLDDIGTEEEIRAALEDEDLLGWPGFGRAMALTLSRHELRRIVEEWRRRNARPPSGPAWREVVDAYRRTKGPRPKQIAVAHEMGWDSEQPLRNRLRELGITNWRDVHALIADDPV